MDFGQRWTKSLSYLNCPTKLTGNIQFCWTIFAPRRKSPTFSVFAPVFSSAVPICWSFSAIQRKSPTFSAARQPQDRRKAVTRQLYEKNCPVSARSLVSDNSSLISRTPGCVCQHATTRQHATVSQHATMRSHATLGTHFATIKKRLAHQPSSVPSRPPGRRHRPRLPKDSTADAANLGMNLAVIQATRPPAARRCLPQSASVKRQAAKIGTILAASRTPSATADTWLACLSRLPRRPVRLWLRFRSGRHCRQRAACPWIPCP